MAVEDMEEYQFGKRSAKEVVQFNKKGGINSGKTRREKAQFKNAIKWLAEQDNLNLKSGKLYNHYLENGIDVSNLNPVELATIGLWFGSTVGKAENYKVLMQGNDELISDEINDTPDVNINVVDNSGLEKVMYDNKD